MGNSDFIEPSIYIFKRKSCFLVRSVILKTFVVGQMCFFGETIRYEIMNDVIFSFLQTQLFVQENFEVTIILNLIWLQNEVIQKC